MKKTLLVCSMLAIGLGSYAQSVELSATSLSSTTLKDGNDKEYGKGSMQKYKAKITMPFYYKKDSLGLINLWAVTASGSLAVLDNKDGAKGMTPDRIINTSLSVSHIMPIARTWYLMAQLGAGIYGEPDHIRWNTVMARGGAIVVHHFNSRFDAGLGASFTTLYDSPLFIPALLVKYDDGKYSFEATIQSGADVNGAVKLSKAFTLRLTAFQWESTPAIIERGGRWRVYSSTMFRSYIEPEFHFAKKSWASVQVGYNYHRSAANKKRKPSSFLGHVDDEDNLKFDPSLLLNATLHIGL